MKFTRTKIIASIGPNTRSFKSISQLHKAGMNVVRVNMSHASHDDLKETIKIGTLTGWDSDNPTSTWGGLIGFIIGKEGVEREFDRSFSEKYFIHRTRQNFERDIDDFENMANDGIHIINRMIENDLNGRYDKENQLWYIPTSLLP